MPMVNLKTVRRVLALDLGLDSEAIDRCLGRAAVVDPAAPESTEIPLADALRVVALAEYLEAPVVG